MTGAGTLLPYALHLHLHLFHLHHHFRGPPVDYGALAAASAASWVGVPGPGEPVLIAAGIFAAKHRLDIVSVVGMAWLGATVGGMAGWLIGLKLGRAVLTAPGPLHRVRLRTVQRGDDVFRRTPVLGVLLAPSWIAGIHGVRPRTFLPVNLLSAALWAFGIGLGSYLAGPAVIDVVDDLGWVLGGGLLLLVVLAAGSGVIRRRRRRGRAARSSPDAERV